MISFRQYLSDKQRFLQLQRGVCIFGCREEHAGEYSNKLKTLSVAARMIRLSDFQSGDGETFPSDHFDELIIYSDVSAVQLTGMSEKLMKSLFTPAYHHGKTVSFFSESCFEDNVLFQNGSSLLHSDKPLLERLLYAEQFMLRIRQVNFQVVTDDMNDPFNTPLIFLPSREFLRNAKSQNHMNISEPPNNGFLHDLELETGEKKYPIVFYSRFPVGGNFHLKNTIFISILQNMDRAEGLFCAAPEKNPAAIDPAVLADPLQSSATHHVNGPIRVLAPAGAGKTKVLISRIIHLISIGVLPDNILALAFNKKAAEEMRNRLAAHHISVAGSLKDNGVVVRTFHSLGYELLREYAGWTFSPDDQQPAMRKILEEAVQMHSSVTHQRNIDALRPFQDMITRYKTELTDDREYVSDPDKNIYPAIFRSMLDRQEKQGCLNYDDMLYLTIRYLLDDPVKRHAVQRRFEFVMVDEFQDLNLSQIWMMRLLSSPRENLFVVGDDDQMIYGWRGAEVKHILDFEAHYPAAVTCVLERNYRSAKAVIHHSKRLIDHNFHRVKKDIKPRDSAPEGSFAFNLSDSLTGQALTAADRIQSIHDTSGCRWSDIAVLYRYHVYQTPVAMALDRLNIPHSPVNHRYLFMTHPGKDLYSYLSVILHPENAAEEDFHRIMKRPNKYITNLTIHSVRDQKTFIDSVKNQKSPGSGKPARMLAWFVESVSGMQEECRQSGISTAGLIKRIDATFKLTAFYRDYGQPVNERDQASDDIIWEVIVSVAESFPDPKEFFKIIRRALHEETEEPRDITHQDEVQLTTIHRTKGNEYRHVIYYNLSDRVLENPSQSEEERRVCYVAVTRAIDDVFITAPEKHFAVFLPELALDPGLSGFRDRQIRRQAYRDLKSLRILFKESNSGSSLPKNKIRRSNHAEWIGKLNETAGKIKANELFPESKTAQAIALITGIIQQITELDYRRKLGKQKTIKLFDLFRKK